MSVTDPHNFDWNDPTLVDSISPNQIEPILVTFLGKAMQQGVTSDIGRREFYAATRVMMALSESLARRAGAPAEFQDRYRELASLVEAGEWKFAVANDELAHYFYSIGRQVEAGD